MEADGNPIGRRVFLVDDHPLTREGLATILNRQPDLEVVGEACNAAEAMAMLPEAKPDLIVTDLTMPGRDGLEFLKDVRAMLPAVPVLVLSMHDELCYAERALRAGARGYVMKHEGGAMLLAAIRAVLGGKIHVSDQMSGRILETYSSPSAHIGVAGLSDREFEVFELLGAGLSTQEIGKRLSLSPKTVDSHRSNIKAKLRLTKMPELVAFAARWISSEAPAKE